MKKRAKKRRLPQCGESGISYRTSGRKKWCLTISESDCGKKGGKYIGCFSTKEEAVSHKRYELDQLARLGQVEWLRRNSWNARTPAELQSAKAGVSWRVSSTGGAWQVRVTVDYKSYTISHTQNEEDAIALLEDWEHLATPDDLPRFLGWLQTRLPSRYAKLMGSARGSRLPKPKKFGGKSFENRWGDLKHQPNRVNDLW